MGHRPSERVWKIRLSLACLAIVALASFELWAGDYCFRNHAMTVLQPTCPQHVWNRNVTGSEVFFSF